MISKRAFFFPACTVVIAFFLEHENGGFLPEGLEGCTREIRKLVTIMYMFFLLFYWQER